MLAMDLRAPRGVRPPALSLTTIASMLAPTKGIRTTKKAPTSRGFGMTLNTYSPMAAL